MLQTLYQEFKVFEMTASQSSKWTQSESLRRINYSTPWPLIESVLSLPESPSEDRRWRITMARGYGETLCAMEDDLEESSEIEIEPKRILELSRSSEEWFYDLRCTDDRVGIVFGVLDSGGLFIQGPRAVGRRLAAGFENVSELPFQSALTE